VGFVLWDEPPKPIDGHTLFDEALQYGICFVPSQAASRGGSFISTNATIGSTKRRI